MRVDGGDVLAVIAAVRAARAAALGEAPLPGGGNSAVADPSTAAAPTAARDPADEWAPAAAAAALPPPPARGAGRPSPSPPPPRRWRHCRPVLVELLTLRAGDHSTSDDAGRYRDAPRLAAAAAAADPISRLRGALASAGWWGSRDADVEAYEREQRSAVAAAIASAEATPPPPASTAFDDVYDLVPPRLAAQRRELLAHLRRHPAVYAGVPVE